MAATWQELIAHYKGYTVGGEAIVRINKKHVSLGKMRNGVFAWTLDGLELQKNTVIPRGIPAASSVVPRAPRKPRAPKIEVEEAPDAGVED